MRKGLAWLLMAMLLMGAAAAESVRMVDAPPEFSEGMLRVTLLDVGTSDCFVIQCGGKTMLLDCALPGREGTILPELARLGVSRIDYAVNTHPHDDHYGSFEAVLQEVPADGFYTCFPLDLNGEQKRLLAAVEGLGVPVISFDAADQFDLAPATVTLFRYENWAKGINNTSMLLRVALGERSMLFAADAASYAQPSLAETYGEALRADILKLPHHGLELKLPFLNAVSPELCMLTGVRSPSKKPAIPLMEKHGLPYLVLPLGTAECVTDGETWQVYQFPNVK